MNTRDIMLQKKKEFLNKIKTTIKEFESETGLVVKSLHYGGVVVAEIMLD